MKNSLAILGCFLLGAVSGVLGGLPEWLQHPQAPFYALIVLLFLVGITVGADSRAWELARRAKFGVFLVPASVICGTLLGVALVAPLLGGISLRDALAVGSGLGYYSLSSILITELHGERLGVVALLANVMREIMTLILAPLLAHYFGKLAPIAAGGATTLDTTLPVVTRYCGAQYTAIAVFSGVALTLLAPLLITLILSF